MVTQVFLSGTELTLFSPTWRSFPGRFDGGNQVITDGDLMNNTQIGAEPYSDRLYPTHQTKVGICNLCICFLSWGYQLVQPFANWLVNLSWFDGSIPSPQSSFGWWKISRVSALNTPHGFSCFWRLPIAQLRALGLNMLYQLAPQIRSPFSQSNCWPFWRVYMGIAII